MNEKLFRPQFNQMDTTEKQALMEKSGCSLRYDLSRSTYLLTAGTRAAQPASSRKMAESSSLSPAIPSYLAGNTFPWD